MRHCKEDEILNPKTGRCVKKNGKTGKEIMKSDAVIDAFASLNIASTSSSRPNAPSPSGKIPKTDELHKSVVFEINGNIDEKNKNIAAFDFDQTIVKPNGAHPFPKNKNDWKFVRVNVPEIIKKLHSSGYSIYVFTNQTKEWKIDMIKESLGTIGIPIKVVIGFGKGAQKPNKKLFFDNVSVKFSKKSFYTGDAWDSSIHFSDSDLEFAKNVGINFKIPEEIFPIELVKKQDSKKYEKSHQEIVILTGFPASGKSTFIKNKLKTYEVVSGDVLKTLPKMLNTATKYLDLGKSVVFDATNPKKENRDKIIQLGKKYKIPVRCFVFNVDIETALEWNTKRFNETGKKVPKIAFYVHRKNYIRPTEEDGCLIVDID